MKSLIPVLFCALLCGQPARADSEPPDHERAGGALARGEVLPLSRILSAVQAAQPGRVIEVELENDDDHYIYEVELVTPEGRLIELEVEAATGMILQMEESDEN